MRLKSILALVCSALLATGAAAEGKAKGGKVKAVPAKPAAVDIDIKGFRIGMPENEARELYRSSKEFTVGGAAPLFDFEPATLDYEDGKLVGFTFFYRSEQYNTLRDALKTKFPPLACTQSEVGNKLGGRFEQETCRLSSGDTLLSIQRFSGDLNTAVLNMMSASRLRRMGADAQKKAASDL